MMCLAIMGRRNDLIPQLFVCYLLTLYLYICFKCIGEATKSAHFYQISPNLNKNTRPLPRSLISCQLNYKFLQLYTIIIFSMNSSICSFVEKVPTISSYFMTNRCEISPHDSLPKSTCITYKKEFGYL